MQTDPDNSKAASEMVLYYLGAIYFQGLREELAAARAKTKRCTKCGQVKLRSEFYKNKTYCDGLTNQCKGCASELQRAKYRSDPDHRARRIAYSIDWAKRNPKRQKSAKAAYDKKHRFERTEAQRNRRLKDGNAYDARWRAEHREEIRERARGYIAAAPEWYTRRVLAAHSTLSPSELPQPLVDAHAAALKLKRLCQHQKTSPNSETSCSNNSNC